MMLFTSIDVWLAAELRDTKMVWLAATRAKTENNWTTVRRRAIIAVSFADRRLAVLDQSFRSEVLSKAQFALLSTATPLQLRNPMNSATQSGGFRPPSESVGGRGAT